jgi:isopenicillin N synthase-like dioxygenase
VDLKEFFHIGREAPNVSHLGQNIWPRSIIDFQPTFERLFKELDALAHRILEVFAVHLGLPQSYFDSRVEYGEALLRVLHYPPIMNANIPNVRAAAHEDINLLTLLVGSQQSGLEVLSRAGVWVPITTIEGTIVCNVGDMLQRLSNGLLPSTTHRVVNPHGEQARTSRYSMPFFMHPSPEVRLDVLPQCISDAHPQKFTPITAGEYLQQRLNEIGLVKNS